MKLQKMLLLVASVIISVSALAKEKPATARLNGRIYGEAGGLGLVYSLNYQHNFYVSKKIDLAAGVYAMPYWFERNLVNGPSYVFSMGTQSQVIYKIGNNEIGIGAAFTYLPIVTTDEYSYNSHTFYTFGQLTYGYTFPNHIFLGAAFTEAILEGTSPAFTPWFGARIGYRF
jgi:hypothetical protein